MELARKIFLVITLLAGVYVLYVNQRDINVMNVTAFQDYQVSIYIRELYILFIFYVPNPVSRGISEKNGLSLMII